jgi:hypothetical protein
MALASDIERQDQKEQAVKNRLFHH